MIRTHTVVAAGEHLLHCVMQANVVFTIKNIFVRQLLAMNTPLQICYDSNALFSGLNKYCLINEYCIEHR